MTGPELIGDAAQRPIGHSAVVFDEAADIGRRDVARVAKWQTQGA